jgi:hypothetical protein
VAVQVGNEAPHRAGGRGGEGGRRKARIRAALFVWEEMGFRVPRGADRQPDRAGCLQVAPFDLREVLFVAIEIHRILEHENEILHGT